jgi:hypothetical protein
MSLVKAGNGEFDGPGVICRPAFPHQIQRPVLGFVEHPPDIFAEDADAIRTPSRKAPIPSGWATLNRIPNARVLQDNAA